MNLKFQIQKVLHLNFEIDLKLIHFQFITSCELCHLILGVTRRIR